MENKIISPCISICRTDPVTGYCYGCARTNEEKKMWKDESISNEWKSENLKVIITRMKGWQLETFKESYDHKINHGISLFKKKLIEKYTVQDKSNDLPKRTDINILLNRVKLNQKNESRKKIYFSAAASAGLFLFGLIIF